MAITISGENNNDRITAQDGVIDTISGFNISGIITASSFTGDLTGDVTGNVTGNINNSTLLLQTGSTERVRITSDGKISTGALASPDGNLHVYSSSAGSVTAAGDANELVLESSADVGMSFLTASNSLSRIKFGDSRQSNRGVIAYKHSDDAIVFHTVGSEKFRITSGGDILIGRTTGLTDAKVSIQCDAGEAGIAVQLNTGTGTSNLLQAYSSAGPNVASITVNPDATPDLMFNVWDGSSTAERLRITSAGNVNIGGDYTQTTYNFKVTGTSYLNGVVRVPAGSAAAPAIHFGDSDSGLYSAAGGSNNVRITAGGSDVLTASTNSVNFPIQASALTSFTIGSQSALSKPLYFADAASVQSASILLDNSSQELRIKNGRFSGQITFTTYNTERLRIDSSGRLLVSGQAALTSTSLNHPIQVAAASDATSIAIFGRAADDIAELDFYENDKTTKLGELQYRQDHLNLRHRVGYISFATGGVTERLRITSDGNLMLGTSTAAITAGIGMMIANSGGARIKLCDSDLGVDGVSGYEMIAANNGTAYLWNRENTNLLFGTNNTERFRIANDGKATFNEQLIISNALPSIKLIDSGNNHYAYLDGNSGNLIIHSDKGNTHSSTSLKFAVDNSVRMSILSNNRVGVMESDSGINGYAENFQVRATYGTGQYGIAVKLNHSSGSLMRFANSSGLCGSITSSGSNSTSFNEQSDYRLKENNVSISNAITRLKLLKPYRFNWKSEPDKTVDGFFAHEVTPAVPEAITGEKDAPIDEIGEGYQKIDYGKLVPLLTAALQEAVARIEALEGS